MDYNEYGEYYDYLRKTLDKNIKDETIKNAINMEVKPPWFYFDRGIENVYNTNDIAVNYATCDSLSTSGNVVYEAKDKSKGGKTRLRRCELLTLKC